MDGCYVGMGEKEIFYCVFCVFQRLVDVSSKEEKGQNSSSATVQRFWAITDCGSKGFVENHCCFLQHGPSLTVCPAIASLCFWKLQKMREDFLAAGEALPESSGVASFCLGSPGENCAGVWVLGISHCLRWALQPEREGLPHSLSRVAVLSSTSWISTSLSFSTTVSLGDLSDIFS